MSAIDAAGALLAIVGAIGIGFGVLGVLGILCAALVEWWRA